MQAKVAPIRWTPNKGMILYISIFGGGEHYNDNHAGIAPQCRKDPASYIEPSIAEAIESGIWRILLHAPEGHPQHQHYMNAGSFAALMPQIRQYLISDRFRSLVSGRELIAYTGGFVPYHRDPTRIDGYDDGKARPEPNYAWSEPTSLIGFAERAWGAWIGRTPVRRMAFDAIAGKRALAEHYDTWLSAQGFNRSMVEPVPTILGSDGKLKIDHAGVAQFPNVSDYAWIRQHDPAGLWTVDPVSECHVIIRKSDEVQDPQIRTKLTGLRDRGWIIGAFSGVSAPLRSFIRQLTPLSGAPHTPAPSTT